MRQVWLLSDSPRTLRALQYALKRPGMGVQYRLDQIDTFEKVSAGHLQDRGVTFILDAFHSKYPGFEGLRHLRELGFEGPVFIAGEPAPEEAVVPFAQLKLTGFLPPLERLDSSVAAGLVHYKLNFGGDFDLKHFLEEGGRSASERIANINDFNQLIRKLMKFVQRFGVNVEKLKRTVVALSGSHVKTTAQGPHVSAPFRICYGVDASKLMLAVSLDLPNSDGQNLSEDFVSGLTHFREPAKAPVRGRRQDFANSARVAGNQILIWGNSREGTADGEAFLLAALPFSREGAPCIDPYFFAFVEARPSVELSDEGLPPITLASRTEDTADVFEPMIAGDLPADEQPAARSAVPAPVRPLPQASPLGDLPMSSFSESLASLDPVPAPSSPQARENLAPPVILPSLAPDKMQAELRKALDDLRHLQKVSDAMAADIKRLMKERREPRTDPELREAIAEGVERAKRLQEANQAVVEKLEKKDAEIKLLQTQLSRLKAA
jgi:hypothetical protein